MGTFQTSRVTPPGLASELDGWLDEHASELDTGTALKAEVVPKLARAGLFRVGVPVASGGIGGHTADAVGAIASLAERSLTAAFVLWGQRTFVEYLLQSPNSALRERLLPDVLDGHIAGATGLSNAMKHLSGIETLQVEATPDASEADCLRLNGKLAWITNLRPEGFVVAAAVARRDGDRASIVAVPHSATGMIRSADLELIALRGSNTAALTIDRVRSDPSWELHPDATVFLSQARPAFLALQCGMSIGLARRSLHEASRASARAVLGPELRATAEALDLTSAALLQGISDSSFRSDPSSLFHIRIALADLAHRAVHLELQASGGRGYLRDANAGFDRRWREAAFIPIVTPSLVQLKAELDRRSRSEAT
ncbi:acyl-CoA/acyl-ACP dehydrogenase [Burkholderia sp. Ac-20345]|uniref:acyl-CoA dehydrogenase family protein n=1 Tax=Burkholderia sp. Ac-20345 TaxID=2703891 RepID=UPI00197B468F|nr:acyl-CoA dehydrogenase family protein [Burkholderia sp. Ac-20345]MBN3778032.1 acyl-CoA/acyl-ACP dehydrogenase [Burkholderia sp. Ac-20345]